LVGIVHFADEFDGGFEGDDGVFLLLKGRIWGESSTAQQVLDGSSERGHDVVEAGVLAAFATDEFAFTNHPGSDPGSEGESGDVGAGETWVTGVAPRGGETVVQGSGGDSEGYFRED
jgi:hypothetical protein